MIHDSTLIYLRVAFSQNSLRRLPNFQPGACVEMRRYRRCLGNQLQRARRQGRVPAAHIYICAIKTTYTQGRAKAVCLLPCCVVLYLAVTMARQAGHVRLTPQNMYFLHCTALLYRIPPKILETISKNTT